MKNFFVVLSILILFIPAHAAEITKTKRQVVISYTLYRIPKIASNQIAIWIEDNSGKMVKTLYATKYTAIGGYKKREVSLKRWVEKFNLKERKPPEVDEITGATQMAGDKTITWDCTDSNGTPVKDGKYYYIFEGNIFWDNMVYAKGSIYVGGKKDKSTAVLTYEPANSQRNGTLFDNVKAVFE